MPKSSQTWVQKAFEAHSRFIEEGYVDLEPGEFDRCWCCGNYRRKLQKCHIIPRALGGSDKPDNIVPLCSKCHDKQPDVADSLHTFEWLKSERNPFTGCGLGDRWNIFCEMMEMINSANPTDLQREAITSWFNFFLEEKVNNHAGQSGQGIYVKDSSYRWAVQKALKKVLVKLPDSN